jgi:xylose isomerase
MPAGSGRHGVSLTHWCDADCYAYACAKTKMAIDVGQKLGGENHVFWGGREGYQSVLNTDVRKELDNLAAFFHMVVSEPAV